MTEQTKQIVVHFPQGKRIKAQHEATHWHVDEDMQLHVKNGKEAVACYGKGLWAGVEVVKEPHSDQTGGKSDKMLDAMNASYQAGRKDSLMLAARIAEERGDIGTGHIKVWTWLRRLADPESFFTCDICETIQPKSDEGPTGSDGRTWCRDCRAEGALSA